MRLGSILIAIFMAVSIPSALAHTTVMVENYSIEAGWGLEPPVVGVRNTFVFHVTEPAPDNPRVTAGIFNAFQNLEATANYGGASKILEINSDPRPGYYYADVIPTKTGSFSITLQGAINDTPVDVTIPIEDAESTALLDFPPREDSSSGDIASIKAAVASIQDEMSASSTTSPESQGMAYDFAVMSISLAAVAIVLGVVSLVRRPRL